jgi:lambda repressor-like predicted transcriptional regulator
MASGINRLRALRNEQGLALWGLAARAGVSASTLSAIERWDYLPTPPVRQRIADALGVDASAIWPEGGFGGESL